ncbi:unnamed protein product [Rotaria socialis]
MEDRNTNRKSTLNMRSNNSWNTPALKPCRDGADCLLQHNGSTEHNECFSHPCCWLDLCRDIDKSDHSRCYTHSTDDIDECKYGAAHCAKLGDLEHRRTHRHNGLPYLLMPCKHNAQCSDRSTEHLKKYKHPPEFYQKTNFSSRRSGSNTKEDCRYGASCRQKNEPAHCDRFQHPITTSSSFVVSGNVVGPSSNRTSNSIRSSYNHKNDDDDDENNNIKSSYSIGGSNSSLRVNKQDRTSTKTVHDEPVNISSSRNTKQECRYGAGCRYLSDPTHCDRFKHPTETASWRSNKFSSNRSNKNSDEDEDEDEDKRTSHSTNRKMSSRIPMERNETKIKTIDNDTIRSEPFSIVRKECRYGAGCRDRYDPTHCSHFEHSPKPSPPFVAAASKFGQSSNPTLNTNRSTRIPTTHGNDDMQKAYRIGGVIALESLSQHEQNSIKNMREDDIIVVPGTYDHIDQVLTKTNLKFTIVQQYEIMTYPFRTSQTVYINCASSFPREAAYRLRELVDKGLHLITTDWALTHVLEVAFSDFVKHNGQATRDEVVGIEVVNPNHAFVKGFVSAAIHTQPQWWLETSSHPIEIVNTDQVKVLIRSQALYDKYRSDAIIISFDCGKGNVTHMISHFYLQRTETVNSRHTMPAQQYAQDIKASDNITKLIAKDGQNLNYAQIQSSATSAQFIYNLVSTRLSTTNQSTSSTSSRKRVQ